MLALFCTQNTLNPLAAAESSVTILMIFAHKIKIRKIFDGVKSIKTLPRTLLQIFCKAIINFRGNLDPDNCWKNSEILMC